MVKCCRRSAFSDTASVGFLIILEIQLVHLAKNFSKELSNMVQHFKLAVGASQVLVKPHSNAIGVVAVEARQEYLRVVEFYVV